LTSVQFSSVQFSSLLWLRTRLYVMLYKKTTRAIRPNGHPF